MLAGVCFGSHCPASAAASTLRLDLGSFGTFLPSRCAAGQVPAASLDSNGHKKYSRCFGTHHSIRSSACVRLRSFRHNSEPRRHRVSCSALGPSICSTSAAGQITIEGDTQEEVYERLVDRVLTTALRTRKRYWFEPQQHHCKALSRD